MSYLLGLLLLTLAGRAILALLGLRGRSLLVHSVLGWFVGCGWFALASSATRFLLGVPQGRWTALGIVLAPIVLGFVYRQRSDARESATATSTPARTLPRPRWLFAIIAIYVVVVALAVILHGANSPTHTDDGVRVRAYTPILAFEDGWSRAERLLFVMAGPVTTFVPSLGWQLGGTVTHFHANYFVGTSLVAFLLLAIGLGMERGSPERGWARAFAALSLPLFVYHCTSTYSDALLAIFLAAGTLFAMEFGAGKDPRDALRAGLIWTVAAMVKREGELLAGLFLILFAVQVAWTLGRDGLRRTLRIAGILALPLALFAATKIGAVGLSDAFPVLSVSADAPAHGMRAAAAEQFAYALFQSGNPGMLFWLLPATIVFRGHLLRRPQLAWPLAGTALLLAQTAYTTVVAFPRFTIDGTTVHRALLTPSLLAAIWIATALTEE